jgi:hypothetical protein
MERLGGRGVAQRGEDRRDTLVRRGKLRLLPLALVGILAVFGLLPGAFLQAPTARASSIGTLTIVVPNPNSSNAAEGPVGANVTISGTSLTASDAYQIGYATQDAGCSSGFTAFGNISVQTDANGNFSTTFAWPSSLASVGTSYYVCAQDASNNQAQSSATFTVAAAQMPTISLQAVAGASPGPGTPSVPTSGYYPGSTVEIDGSNFLPNSVPLLVYLYTSPIQQPSDLQKATQLQPVNGQNITAGSDGTIKVTVQIPYSETPGSYYLSLVSADSQVNALPSLLASASLTVAVAPTPTPTPSPSPTAGTGTTTVPPLTTHSTGPGADKVVALVGLGGLSLALFILGVVLLASAAALPRQA